MLVEIGVFFLGALAGITFTSLLAFHDSVEVKHLKKRIREYEEKLKKVNAELRYFKGEYRKLNDILKISKDRV